MGDYCALAEIKSLSVKFGLMRSPLGSIIGNDLRPSAVKNSPA
jgi:hypothetical protein